MLVVQGKYNAVRPEIAASVFACVSESLFKAHLHRINSEAKAKFSLMFIVFSPLLLLLLGVNRP